MLMIFSNIDYNAIENKGKATSKAETLISNPLTPQTAHTYPYLFFSIKNMDSELQGMLKQLNPDARPPVAIP